MDRKPVDLSVPPAVVRKGRAVGAGEPTSGGGRCREREEGEREKCGEGTIHPATLAANLRPQEAMSRSVLKASLRRHPGRARGRHGPSLRLQEVVHAPHHVFGRVAFRHEAGRVHSRRRRSAGGRDDGDAWVMPAYEPRKSGAVQRAGQLDVGKEHGDVGEGREQRYRFFAGCASRTR
jgi:hypothetical protein